MVDVADPDFQLPLVDDYTFRPDGSPWTWANFAGVCAVSGPFVLAAPPSDLPQSGFMATNWVANGGVEQSGSASQTLDFGDGGLYTFGGYYLAGQSGSASGLVVSLDSTVVFTGSPSATWSAWLSGQVSVAGGTHLLTLASPNESGSWAVAVVGISVDAVVVESATTVAQPARWVPRPRGRGR